jgi:sugar/nucleoside kinase (ribokinase family)
VIVVAGVANIEVGVPVDGFPVEYVPARYPRWGIGIRVGGVGFNVAAAVAALGGEVRFATLLAPDPWGVLVGEELRRRGLSGPGVCVSAGGTAQSVVLHDPAGRRMVSTDLKDLPGAEYSTEVFAALLPGADVAVVTNIGFCRPLLAVAADAGVPIAVDVQAIDSVDDAYNADWMAAARVLLCSHERLPCSPEDWVREVWDRYGWELVVVGCGEHGAVLGQRTGRTIHRAPAVAPRGVVNTVGAGDALAAAFVHVLARTGDPRVAIEQAVIFAGYRVGGAAGENGWLTAEELATRHRSQTRPPSR